MSPEVYAWVERVHGHVGVLGLAVLLHPVITLRRRPGLPVWTRRTAWLGAVMLAVPFALGWWIYPTYRSHVKGALWLEEHPALWRFESKEHLAALCVVLAFAGAATLQAAGAEPAGRRTAWALLLASWCCGVLVAAFGVYVAGVAQPGW